LRQLQRGFERVGRLVAGIPDIRYRIQVWASSYTGISKS
jgi:hypothetical protein